MATSALIVVAVMLGFALAGLFAWAVCQLLPEEVDDVVVWLRLNAQLGAAGDAPEAARP